MCFDISKVVWDLIGTRSVGGHLQITYEQRQSFRPNVSCSTEPVRRRIYVHGLKCYVLYLI